MNFFTRTMIRVIGRAVGEEFIENDKKNQAQKNGQEYKRQSTTLQKILGVVSGLFYIFILSKMFNNLLFKWGCIIIGIMACRGGFVNE